MNAKPVKKEDDKVLLKKFYRDLKMKGKIV